MTAINKTLITNAEIVLPSEVVTGNILINNGVIAEISSQPIKQEVDIVIDAEGDIVLAGMIDSHVHIRGGPLSYREDFYSGTSAAASGGITTIYEMPIGKPPTSTIEQLLIKQKEIKENAVVDYAMYGGAGADNINDIELLGKSGIIGYKTFLMPPVPGREAEFFGLCADRDEDLFAVMKAVAKTGKILAIHSELNEYIHPLEEEFRKQDDNSLDIYTRSRPKESEILAAKKIIEASRQTNCPTVICHVSAQETMKIIMQAKEQGVRIWAETCPQYLYFTNEGSQYYEAYAKIKPPIRNAKNAEELRTLFDAGAFDAIGSDHAPYTMQEKLTENKSIWDAASGLPGIELSMLMLLSEVSRNGLDICEFSKAISMNVAETFGISQKKGSIEIGKDADLVFVRKAEKPYHIQHKDLITKSRDCAKLYETFEFDFKITRTLVRGKLVFSDGKILAEKGWGEWVKPRE